MIYCNSCKDFIYDQQCQAIAEKHLRKEARNLNKSVSWRPWIPSQVEMNLLRQHPKRRHVTPCSSIGLRGLLNLGSTCFMNCIVQALIHTPLLRDYFLSERHECSIKSSINCLVCEVSRLFQVNLICRRFSTWLNSFSSMKKGVLFWSSRATVTASSASSHLESRKAFGRLRTARCSWIFYGNLGCFTSSLWKLTEQRIWQKFNRTENGNVQHAVQLHNRSNIHGRTTKWCCMPKMSRSINYDRSFLGYLSGLGRSTTGWWPTKEFDWLLGKVYAGRTFRFQCKN